MKWNESGLRPPLCTYRLNWARRTSWGCWDDWDDTVLQTQDSKFEPWRSEAEHVTSQSRRLPTILTFARGWGRNVFVSFKPPKPGTEPQTLAWKAAVLTTTLGPPPVCVSDGFAAALGLWHDDVCVQNTILYSGSLDGLYDTSHQWHQQPLAAARYRSSYKNIFIIGANLLISSHNDQGTGSTRQAITSRAAFRYIIGSIVCYPLYVFKWGKVPWRHHKVYKHRTHISSLSVKASSQKWQPC